MSDELRITLILAFLFVVTLVVAAIMGSCQERCLERVEERCKGDPACAIIWKERCNVHS